MTKESITVVYDRKKKVETTGRGKVELSIYLAKGERKYVTIKECSPVGKFRGFGPLATAKSVR